jgi:uncharacterized protein
MERPGRDSPPVPPARERGHRLDTTAFLVIAFGLGIGAICKGVTGMGLPLVATPVLAAYFGLPHAIAVMAVPAVATNIWQFWTYRHHEIAAGLAWRMIAGGLAGIAIGTALLRTTPGSLMSIAFGTILLAYVALRLLRPSFALPTSSARRYGAPVSFVGGLLQGAMGIAAPAIVTFLNAMRLERGPYIALISSVYLSFAVFQMIALASVGLVTTTTLAHGLFSLLPVTIFMAAGTRLARHVSPRGFDLAILALLVMMAARFLYAGVTTV